MFTSQHLVESNLHCHQISALHSAQPCCLFHWHFQLTEDYTRTFCSKMRDLKGIKDQAVA